VRQTVAQMAPGLRGTGGRMRDGERAPGPRAGERLSWGRRHGSVLRGSRLCPAGEATGSSFRGIPAPRPSASASTSSAPSTSAATRRGVCGSGCSRWAFAWSSASGLCHGPAAERVGSAESGAGHRRSCASCRSSTRPWAGSSDRRCRSFAVGAGSPAAPSLLAVARKPVTLPGAAAGRPAGAAGGGTPRPDLACHGSDTLH